MAQQNSSEARKRITGPIKREYREPDWALWEKISNAPLWEVVAVSCKIEPQQLRGWSDVKANPSLPKSFIDRLSFAESILSIHGGGLNCQPEGIYSRDARVELGNFRAWLENEGFDFPPEFPKHTAKNPPEETYKERQLRLTHRIQAVRANRKDFMAFVADEEDISISRLQKIVGTRHEQERRLTNVLK